MTANVLHDIIDDLIYTQQVLPKSEIRTISFFLKYARLQFFSERF